MYNSSLRDGEDEVTVNGSAGSDESATRFGDDEVHGGSGNDWINDPQIYGTEVFVGITDDDTIYGGSGNDHISTRVGADIVYGGTGDDQIKSAPSLRTDISYNDFAAPDTLYGGDGNDRVFAVNGSTLFGGEGEDTIATFL
ncbi:calcium-binding protein [Pseudooctadecabacter sp.]|uniref:calcium-binding protein n=1 Tax=Pseudooctadecabacter sp. TaxID=1966338 RepID=UPI0035C87511